MNLTFTVAGIPVPQGSKRGFIRHGRVLMTEDNKKTRPWRDTVCWTAMNAVSQAGQPVNFNGDPVLITLKFRFPRPSNHYRSDRKTIKPNAPHWKATRPDIDKLVRAIFDALQDAGIIRDDGQIAGLVTNKTFGEEPGVLVSIWRAGEGERPFHASA